MECKKCGNTIDEDAKFCLYCGVKVNDETIICPKCNKEISSDYHFCPYCDAKLNDSFDDPLLNYVYPKKEFDRASIKEEAKEVLRGNMIMMFVVILILAIIKSALTAAVVAIILAPIADVCLFYVTKNLLINKKVDFEMLVKPFSDINHLIKIVGAYLLVNLIIFFGLLLFIVPGIIWALKFSQVLRLMVDDKTLSITDALNKSEEIMNGKKTELLLFYFSFIGHFLLFMITLGIYGIYFLPYYATADTNFYFYLRGQN